jgi:hypothetical protein
MIHLYAFADGLRDLPAVEGLDSAPLESRRLDGLDAVFSRRDHESTGESLHADAVVHGKVVEALVDRAAAVLPVRFGELSPDDEALARAVRERAAGLRRGLDHVRGCVEIGVRISSVDAIVATTGTEYMRLRREASGQELHAQLRRLAREARSGAESAVYLVPRETLATVRDCAQRFARGHPQLTVVCTGPWAPYSFTGPDANA